MPVFPTDFIQDSRTRPVVWWAVLTSTLLSVAMIGLWTLQTNSNRHNAELLIKHQNRSIETLIRQDLVVRLAAIDRLAERWTVAGGTPQVVWEADATKYLSDMPGFRAFEWVDSDQQLQWRVASKSKDGQENLSIHDTTPASSLAFAAANENSEPTLSQPFELGNAGFSMLIFVPVTRDGKSDGLMVGVLVLGAWLDTVLANSPRANYSSQIFIADKPVYERGYSGKPLDDTLTRYREFELQGLRWATKITPTQEFISRIRPPVPMHIWVSGLTLSTLFGLFIYQSLTMRLRARELHAATSHNMTLMQNLQGMAYRTVGLEYPWPMASVSAGCRALCDHEQSDLQTQRVLWGELIHPEDLDRIVSEVRNAVKNDSAFELEYRICTRKGGVKWVWDRGRSVKNTDTKKYDLVGFISDVTERKLTELTLVQEQGYSKSIVDTAADGIITIDIKGAIDNFNNAAERMFNYCAAEVLGKNIRMLMPQPYRDEHDSYLHSYAETGEAHIIGIGRTVSAQRKDGTVFPIQLSVSEIDGQSKRMFVGIIRDISAEKAAEKELRVQREQLAHVDRLHLLGEMASGIAHEINQPLTSISLFSQAGKRFLDSGAFNRLPDIFDKLSQHALRAGAIIEKMQAMTRQRESEKTMVDCNTLIKGIRQLAEAETRIHDIEINLELALELPLVAVDIVQLQQVVLNLLRNGMEAMRSLNCRNGDTIVLKTCLRDDGDIEIRVIDSGGGVSEEASKKAFSPFWTSKDSGMGMGLSICRAIVIAHGGLLDFVNNESSGATFFIYLPTAKHGEQNE